MDKREDKGTSALTPCRPVGLRRKRSSIKNSPFKLLCPSDITSPTSVNGGSIKACSLTDAIEVCSSETGIAIDLKTLGNNERRDSSNKRKSTAPHGKSSISKKITCQNTGDTDCNDTKTEKIGFDDEKSLFAKNDFPVSGKSENGHTAGSDENYISIPVTPAFISTEKPIEKKNITASELSALREKIAIKEKKLKELRLSALYKKKHNHEQVAKEIEIWLQSCKKALYALKSELAKRGQTYSVAQLLKNLGIPTSLLEIDEDSD